LIFAALSHTSVTNVVLIGRLEPPLTLALSAWLLRSLINPWTVAGAMTAFIGVAVTVLMGRPPSAGMMMGLGEGDFYMAIAAILGAVSTIISKINLQLVPLGIFSIYRNIVGTIVFFCLAIGLYGAHHFQDAFAPFLWQWMVVYAGIIIGAIVLVGGLETGNPSDDDPCHVLYARFGDRHGVHHLGGNSDTSTVLGGRHYRSGDCVELGR
jgi:drug/metabolite transporter (DMT)-like permease